MRQPSRSDHCNSQVRPLRHAPQKASELMTAPQRGKRRNHAILQNGHQGNVVIRRQELEGNRDAMLDNNILGKCRIESMLVCLCHDRLAKLACSPCVKWVDLYPLLDGTRVFISHSDTEGRHPIQEEVVEMIRAHHHKHVRPALPEPFAYCCHSRVYTLL